MTQRAEAPQDHGRSSAPDARSARGDVAPPKPSECACFHVYRVPGAFTEQLASLRLQVSNKVAPLHPAAISTVPDDVAVPELLAGKRPVRLDHELHGLPQVLAASSRVAPCVLAPGSSSTKAM